MPIIPKLQESQVLEQRAPVQQVETTAGREFGEGLAAFGQGVQRASQGIADLYRVEKFKKDKEAEFQAREAKAMLEEAAQRQQYNAASNPNKDKTGADLVPTFTDKYSEEAAQIVANVTNPEAKRMAAVYATEYKTQFRGDLYKTSNVLFAAEATRRVESFVKQQSGKAKADPDNFEYHRGESMKIMGMMSGVVPNEMIDQAREEVVTEMAKGAIEGYVAQGRFDDARKALLDPQSGMMHLIATKDQTPIRDKIDDAEMERFTRSNTIIDTKNKRAKESLEKQQNDHFFRLIAAKYDGVDIEVEWKTLYAAEKLSEQHRTILVGETTVQSETTSQAARAVIVAQVTDGRVALDKARSQTLQFMEQGKMKGEHGVEMLRYIDTVKNDRRNRNKEEGFLQRRSTNIGVINSKFASWDPIMARFTKDDDRIAAANAKKIFDDAIYLRGMSQDDALELTFKTLPNRPSVSDVPTIPGLSRDDYGVKGSFKKAKAQYVVEYQTMSPKDRKVRMQALEKLKAYEDFQNEKGPK